MKCKVFWERKDEEKEKERAAARAVVENEVRATTARSLDTLHGTAPNQGQKSRNSSMQDVRRNQAEDQQAEGNAQAVDGDNGASR